MTKFDQRLKEWVLLGLITQAQANQIGAHESTKPENRWILSGLLTLGVVIIGIGVISLIAANWDKIPDSIKLCSDFIVLTGLAFLVLRDWSSEKNIRFEALLLFFLIFCLASIGLIAQIYHVEGRFYQALMLWSGITVGAALLARRQFIPLMWCAGFLTGITFTAAYSPWFLPTFKGNFQAIIITLFFLCANLALLSKRILTDTKMLQALWLFTLISGILALGMMETEVGLGKNGMFAYLPAYILACSTVLGIAFSAEYRNSQKTLLGSTIIFFLLIPFLPPPGEVSSDVIHAFLTILVLSLMAVFFASLKARRLFQECLFLIALRFLILYFQALGGLATTGLGLVLSGMLIIAIVMAWNKYREKLALWLEECV